MEFFTKKSEILALPKDVFAFYESPDAFRKLIPPWEKVEIIETTGGLSVGARVVLRIFILGPISQLWIAEHTEYIPGQLFVDVQKQGPFSYWRHKHIFETTPKNTTLMIDEVEYELPFSFVGKLMNPLVKAKLQKMFDYRHKVVSTLCNK